MLLLIALLSTCPAPFQPLDDGACGCSRTPRKVLYDGRCLSSAELTKAYVCPEGAKATAEDSAMFWDRVCERPDGVQLGPATTWIVARDSVGRPMRRVTLDAVGAGEFLFFHPNSTVVAQRHEMKGGKLHGVQRMFRPDGSLQEVFHRSEGKLHGLSTEYAADGETPKILRCLHAGDLVWKQEGAPLDAERPCPPKGFDPASKPDDAVHVWLKLDVSLLDAPYGLAALPDGGLLFTRNAKDAKLWRIEKPGAEPVPLADFEDDRPGPVVLAPPGRAFVLGQRGVWSVDLKSGKATRAVELDLAHRRQTLAWGDGALFWTEARQEWSDAPPDPGRVRTLRGGAARTLEEGRRPVALAVGGKHVWWADAQGEVRRAPLRGGPVEVVHRLEDELEGLGLDGDRVYVTGPGIGLAPAGGATLASGVRTHRLQFDATHVFWIDGDGLFRVPKSGGSNHALTLEPNSPRSLVWRKVAGEPAQLCWTDIVEQTIACIDHRARKRRFGEAL